MFTTRMDIGSRVAGQPAVENDEFVTFSQVKYNDDHFVYLTDGTGLTIKSSLYGTMFNYTFVTEPGMLIYKKEWSTTTYNWNKNFGANISIYIKTVYGGYINWELIPLDLNNFNYVVIKEHPTTTEIVFSFPTEPPPNQTYSVSVVQPRLEL